jgi:ribosomal protein S18 acetylase RimI-like enzyme
VLGDAPYGEPMLASVDAALRSTSAEYRAIVAHEGGAVVGVVAFGETAGAVGAGRVYFVAVDASARRRGIATALTEAACAELRERGARFAVIELPEESRLEGAHVVARRAGFSEEARVSDYVRNGVDLVVLRRDLSHA